jgi:hypothetical protein
MLTHGIQLEWSKYLKKNRKKGNLGEPLVYLTSIASNMQNPCGNLTFSTWILLNESMLTHGKNVYGENILRK